jgi:diguanylate cyclase (GGDEF)-like protein/PAS domain S-box-containing protein
MITTEICRPDDGFLDAPEAESRELLLQQGPDVTMLVGPDGICRHVTAASLWVIGRTPAELNGTDLRDLAVEADRDALEQLLVQLAGDEARPAAEFRFRHAESPLWLEARGRRLTSGEGAVVTLRDVTARKEGEAVLQEANSLLRHRATIDIVTGLLNRDHFVATLERELRRAQRDRTQVAIIALSLSHFRDFSDRYGWETADAALRSVAGAARSALLRAADTAARLESGEFAILLPGTDAQGTEVSARRVKAAVAALGIVHAGAPSGLLEAIVGVAISTPGCEAYGLLRKAHAALRAVKPRPLAAAAG